jgi:hypothetical protein
VSSSSGVLAVAIRKWIPLFFAAAAMSPLALLTGCGGTNTTNVQNPPAPPASSVSIAFQPAPAGNIALNATTTLTASVTNDPSSAGVDWSLLCPTGGSCGTLLPLHTASGAAATYTPPTTISGNSQAFTIEAFAAADHTKNVAAAITVTGFASNLKGTYVFESKGIDANGPFQVAGVIVLDGNGGITSGEQTHSDVLLSVADKITGGSYTIGPDGRGTMTLNTADQAIGQLGIENLSLAFLSSSQALLATMDNPNLSPSFETSSGTLDLQTSTTAPTGGYSFAVNGVDVNAQPMAMGGILNIDSPAAISGAGSVADQDDIGAIFPDTAISGSLTTPDSFGSLKFNLTTAFSASPVQFTAYIVDTSHIKLIESDITGSGVGVGATAGIAIGQGTATGTFTGNAAFSGNYVFDVLGVDLNGLPSSLASLGVFTADANGNLTNGYNDELLDGFGIYVSDSFTGTYTADPSGNGRVDSFVNFTSNGAGPELIFYLTGNGNPPLLLDADANFGAFGVGQASPQAAPPLSFNGTYGLSFLQSSGSLENHGTGQITANGTAETLSGVIDTNLQFSALPNTPLTGTFDAIPSNGRSTGGLTNTFFPTPGTTPSTIEVTYYVVDASHVFFLESDSIVAGELTFGYFAARTPVCPTCP